MLYPNSQTQAQLYAQPQPHGNVLALGSGYAQSPLYPYPNSYAHFHQKYEAGDEHGNGILNWHWAGAVHTIGAAERLRIGLQLG